MERTKLRALLPAAAAGILLTAAVACNDDSNSSIESYGPDTSVAITGFKLKANSEILANLDTVFFSIDLEHAVIFNADSLPKGTKVTDLIPVISYPSSVSEAVITMTGGEKRTGEVNYKSNPSDSIDFTGDVVLRLTAQDGTTTRDYRLKVNVHKMESDTLMWDQMASSTLPSRGENPTGQKSVKRGESVYCMVREADGSLTVSHSAQPGPGSWESQGVQENGTFDIRTFSATNDAFYILGTDGTLYTSTDAAQWSDTGRRWTAVLGGFGSALLGIDSQEGRLRHVSYPDIYPVSDLEEDFPVKEYSNLGVFTNKWSPDPTCILSGGLKADGTPAAGIWAFDGSQWACLSTGGAATLNDAALIPYYIYRKTSVSWIMSEFKIWLLVGGRKTDGTPNRTVYMSYDNGVNWISAVDYMQLPEYITSLIQADPIVLEHGMNANLQDAWKKMPARQAAPWMIKHELNGYELSWQCPYIYLFGGRDGEGRLSTTVWRGVLNRLTFTPLL